MFGRDMASLLHAGIVLAREGAFNIVDPRDAPAIPALGLRFARLISKGKEGKLPAALERLGPTYIKLGQFLATRRDIVGVRVADDLSSLQDRMPAFPDGEARAEIEKGLGVPVDELFAEFGPAVAAASIAQVHRARLKDGREVAVKVLRPDIERRFRRDLQSFASAARLAERMDAEARRLRLTAVVAELERSSRLEMDLRMEAAALAEMAVNISDDPGFRVPDVIWRATSKRVLTTEWIDGLPISDLERVQASHHDLPALARSAIQNFLRHALRDGFFHADMHPGNLFVEDDGTLVAVDFGIMGRLGAKERRFLAEILWGFIRQDYTRTAQVHFEAGYVPAHQSVADFAQALRAIGTPIRDASAQDISMARLLSQLLEVTDLFGMETRPELLLLQKTMVVVEGVSRNLDPQFDMWDAAEPVVGDWIARNLGPAGRVAQAAEGAGALGRFVTQLPDLAERAEVLSREMAANAADVSRQETAHSAYVVPAWIAAGALVILAVATLVNSAVWAAAISVLDHLQELQVEKVKCTAIAYC